MIKVINGEITYPQDKHQTIQLTLFLVSNLIEIANLNDEEIENVAGVLERLFRGKSEEVLKEIREKKLEAFYKDLNIKKIF